MDVFDSLCFLLLWHSFIYSISSPLLRHQTQKQVKPFLNILRRTFSSFFLFFLLCTANMLHSEFSCKMRKPFKMGQTDDYFQLVQINWFSMFSFWLLILDVRFSILHRNSFILWFLFSVCSIFDCQFSFQIGIKRIN